MANWTAVTTLMSLVFFLGIRHALEPDHLAVVNSMTRCTSTNTHSKWVGVRGLKNFLLNKMIKINISVSSRWWPIFLGMLFSLSEGHGFGLHSSALSANELGGSLQATSKGIGCGATFVLTLPLNNVF